tara:strand:+ start:4139 stop:4708 length:570 start_codon:yes stop_codon:yes gene_type:complete
MINKLLIGEKLVEIETDIVYKGIELKYNGELYIENLLPDDYIVSKKNGIILIIRFNLNQNIPLELFNYDGYCNIVYARIIDSDLKSHDLIISKPSITTWGAIGSSWDVSKSKYEDLKNIGRNDMVNTFITKDFVDPDTKARTTTRESGTKPSNRAKKDINLTDFNKLSKKYNKKQKSLKKGTKRIKRGY